MSTLSEHTGNGTPTERRLQREDPKEQIVSILQKFDVLPSRFDQSIFKYIFVISIPVAYRIIKALSIGQLNIVAMGQVGVYLLDWLLLLGTFYCIGIMTWVVYISGLAVRKLVQAFQLRIQPFHLDHCGGLTLLGNFCFGLVSPLLVTFGIIIGYILFTLLAYSPERFGRAYNADILVLGVVFPLLLLLLYILPTIVLVFILPLRDIHMKMVREGKTNENIHVTRIEALREEIQALLATNQVEEAKVVQEKKTLVETLYMPYPTWPFHGRLKIYSTVLGVSGSLLIGVITGALQRYILTLLFHTL